MICDKIYKKLQGIFNSLFLYFSILILLCSYSSERYTISNSLLIERYKKAKKLIEKKQFPEAKKILLRLTRANRSFIEAHHLLAFLYNKLGETKKCLRVLNKIVPILPRKKFEHIYLSVSKLYYRSGEYKKADRVLKVIKKNTNLLPAVKLKVKNLSKSIKFSIKAVNNKTYFNPRLLPKPLNLFAAQYFPVLSIDKRTILFTGRTNYDLSAQENIYISKKQKNGKWSQPVSVAKSINTASNEGACTLSADGNTLIFGALGRKENYGSCDLYVSYKKGKKWTQPVNLGPNINSAGWQSQPSLSADGKTLFFSSKRRSNIGKKDIWMSRLDEDGKWTKAVNLGKKINSKGIEISPFIHPNGITLFFASDRTPSLGGLDLYYSVLIGDKWSKPINIGYPINNHKDQVSLFITADGSKGYYAAGTQKGIHYNGLLYEFEIPKGLIPTPRCSFIQGKIKLESVAELPDAKISVIDVEKKQSVFEVRVTPENGNFCIPLNEGRKYNVIVEKQGYLTKTVEIDLKKTKQLKEINIDFELKSIKKGKKIILQNVFFGFDEYKINEEAKQELSLLAKFLKENKNVKILVEGYTDDIGSVNYNKLLSYKRARSVYEYIVEKGISSERVYFKGLGKINLMITTEEKRKMSRKASFKIISK